jgi:hypothetical protein
MARPSQAGNRQIARPTKHARSRARPGPRRAKSDRPAEAAKPARALKRPAAQAKAGGAVAVSGAADRSGRPAIGRGAPAAPGPGVTASAPRAPAAGPGPAGAAREAKAPAAPEVTERASTAGPSAPRAAGNSGARAATGAAPGTERVAADGNASSRARATGQAPDLSAMLRASHSVIAGSIRVRSQLVEFSCRQAEHGFAFGRALLAGGSLPTVWALQARYLARAFDDALAHTLEVSRLSTDVVRAGLESLRPR